MPAKPIRKILILTREYDGLAGAGGVKKAKWDVPVLVI